MHKSKRRLVSIARVFAYVSVISAVATLGLAEPVDDHAEFGAKTAADLPVAITTLGNAAAEPQIDRVPADQPSPRNDANSRLAHRQLLKKAKEGRIDVYFIGDSITRRWGTSDPQYAHLLKNWNENFFGWNAANFGWGADTTQNILWRLENGELDGVHPKVIVILAGTNNLGAHPDDETAAKDVTAGIKAIVNVCRQKAPNSTIVLTAIFPRNDNIALMPTITKINENIARLADGKRIRYLDVNDRLAEKNGRLLNGVMNDDDQLHPTVKGYQVWALGLKPIFIELLGPPAKVDRAPAPTGDPSQSGGTD